MPAGKPLEIFLACAPGHEPVLAHEAQTKGFKRVVATAGGVSIRGGWPDVWRANLWLRGTSRVTVRIAQFHADDLGNLEQRARALPWAGVLKPGAPV
jgi:putative N6-adenine-specific DNA methylase